MVITEILDRNARLYGGTVEQNQRLGLLTHITRLGAATLDLQELLQTVAESAGLIIGVLAGFNMGHTWLNTGLGLITGLGVMFLLYLFGMLFVYLVNKRRDEKIDEVALGFGDVTLTGVMGAILGWPGIWAGLVLAILLGGIASLGYMLWLWLKKRYELNTVLPYGPYLIVATIILIVIRDVF